MSGIFVMMLCQSVLRAVMSSRITGFSDPRKKGEVAGIMSSMMTLGMIIGPLVIGYIYIINHRLPFIISGIVLFIAFIVAYASRHKIPEKKFHHEEVTPIETI